MTQLDSSNYSESSLVLTGAEEPQIEILYGGLFIEEELRKRLKENLTVPLWDEESIINLIKAGNWTFSSQGKFRFTPSPNSDYRDDLYPIVGNYTQIDRIFEFQGERRSPEGHSVSLDGILYPLEDNETYLLELVYILSVGTPKIAQISQHLCQQSSETHQEIAGIQVPSRFRILLHGQTETQPFESLSGTLKIMPKSHPGDLNPFEISLSTDIVEGINGRFSWNSFTKLQVGEGQQQGQIVAKDGEVQVELFPNLSMQFGMTWDTLNQGNYANLFPIIGVDITSGSLTFSIQGDRISGEINAVGKTNELMGEIPRDSNYTAQFKGQKQAEEQLLSEPVYLPETSTEKETAAIEQIPVPSIFKVSLQGKTETQPFALSATLRMWPCFDPDNSNPFDVTLTTDLATSNGWIAWFSSDEREGVTTLNSKIEVEGNQVRLEIQPSDHQRMLTWYTLTQDESLSDSSIPIPVHVERGTLTFTIEGEELVGEIQASGVLMSDFQQASTYEAKIRGQKQVSHLSEAIKKTLEPVSFQGYWHTENEAFGQIQLQANGEIIQGNYTEKCDGTIEGIIQSNRLDFTWNNNQKEKGWGFFRSVFQKDLLVGFWGYGNNKTNSQNLVAVRNYIPLVTNQILTDRDAEELNNLGKTLVNEGRYEPARELLEQVLDFYQEEYQQKTLQQQNYLSIEDVLIKEFSILSYLIRCDLGIGDYDRLLHHLVSTLEVQDFLKPQVSTMRLLKERMANLIEILDSSNELFELSNNSYRDWQKSLGQEKTEFIFVLKCFYNSLEALKSLLVNFRNNLADSDSSIFLKQADPVRALVSISESIKPLEKQLNEDIYKLINIGKEVIKEHQEILKQLELIFSAFNSSQSFPEILTNSDINNYQELDKREKYFICLIEENLQLSNLEKKFIIAYHTIIITLLGLPIRLEFERNFLQKMDIQRKFAINQQQTQNTVSNLAENIETWRQKLVTDLDKIDALGKGQLFFQKLINVLIELESPTKALLALEKSKTRAFVDLLATPRELEQEQKQIFAKEQILLSTAKAPTPSFQDILETLSVLDY